MYYDVRKLIRNIRDRALLWDKGHADYRNQRSREVSWLEIGETMYENWLQLTLVEKEEKVEEMKEKWRNVRDTYLKRVCHQKRVRKKYVHSDDLEFLQNSYKKQKRTQRREFGDGRNVTKRSTMSSRFKVLRKQRVQRCLKLPRTTPSKQALIKMTIKKDGEQEEEDADKLFLISLLPEYKKLSEDEKLELKLITTKFFQNSRNKSSSQGQVPDSSNQSCPFQIQQSLSDNFQKPFFQMQLYYPMPMPPTTSSIQILPTSTSSLPLLSTPPPRTTVVPFSQNHHSTLGTNSDLSRNYIQTTYSHQF